MIRVNLLLVVRQTQKTHIVAKLIHSSFRSNSKKKKSLYHFAGIIILPLCSTVIGGLINNIKRNKND